MRTKLLAIRPSSALVVGVFAADRGGDVAVDDDVVLGGDRQRFFVFAVHVHVAAFAVFVASRASDQTASIGSEQAPPRRRSPRWGERDACRRYFFFASSSLR